MDRLDFLREVFNFCRVKDDDNSLMRLYDSKLTTKLKVNWSKLLSLYLDKAETRSLPTPKYFLDLMPICIIREVHECANDGNLIRIFFQSGRFTDFVLCGFGMTLAEIKEKSQKNDNVKEVRMYPKNIVVEGKNIQVALIGDFVYPENTPYEILYIRA